MSFLIGLMSALSVFFFYNAIIEIVQNKKSKKFALYDEITNSDEFEPTTVQDMKARSLPEKLRVLLESSNMPFDFQEFITLSIFIYGFTAFMSSTFLGVFTGLIFGFVPLALIYFYMQSVVKNRNKKVVHQLPDFAIMFASGYEAGYSVENCFDYCAKELKFPINEEMREIFSDITDRKLSLTRALNNWYERNPSPDILFSIRGLLLCQEKSGDVSTIMRSLQEKLRDRTMIDRFILKKTQGVKYVARFIQAVPIAALAIAYVSGPAKFMDFATSLFGVIGFGIMGFFYFVGTILMRSFIQKVYKD